MVRVNTFCNITTFTDAVEKCASLLSDDNLSNRGLQEFRASSSVEQLREFLRCVKEVSKGSRSYEQLLGKLQSSELPSVRMFSGYTGKILDAVQVLKPGTLRCQMVVKTIRDALGRTGHAFLWKRIRKEEKERYSRELVEATATFCLLEVAFLKAGGAEIGRNPLSSFRMSMGGRLPEEYFAELVAGWLVEDVVGAVLEAKDLEVCLTGVDRERRILFARPSGMSSYDLQVSVGGEQFYLEVQRVGKLSRSRQENYFKTALKAHKYQEGDKPNKVLILWIGEDPPQLPRAYRERWYNALIFIPGIKNREEVKFKDDEIYFSEKLLENFLRWEEFIRADQEEVLDVLKSRRSGF